MEKDRTPKLQHNWNYLKHSTFRNSKTSVTATAHECSELSSIHFSQALQICRHTEAKFSKLLENSLLCLKVGNSGSDSGFPDEMLQMILLQKP